MTAPQDTASTPLRHTPLHALQLELGARMVPFAGYAMPVQYPTGLLAEHRHTRQAAGLFDISHMGQMRISGPEAAAALESLMPVDVCGLPAGRQRYGLLLNDAGGILDDLMLFNEGEDNYFLIVNGACKAADLAHITVRIDARCHIEPLTERALLALQGPQAAATLSALSPGIERFVFMSGGQVRIGGIATFVTRSGYTGEDGFEISVAASDAEALARLLLAQEAVQPIGLGARNSLRLEAGLCLYGNDIDAQTTPAEAGLGWAVQKVRRDGGARAGGFPGAAQLLAQLADPAGRLQRQRVGLVALDRVPVREGTPLLDADGATIGSVTSGLLSPTLDQPIAMGYVPPAFAAVGTKLQALVRGKPVAMEVRAMPFVPTRYFRG